MQALLDRYNREGYHLRIIAITVRKHFELAHFTKVLATLLEVEVDDVILVVSQVGLHASAPFMTYGDVRHYSREANDLARMDRAAAIDHLATRILERGQTHRSQRHTMLFVALGALVLLLTAFILAPKLRPKN